MLKINILGYKLHGDCSTLIEKETKLCIAGTWKIPVKTYLMKHHLLVFICLIFKLTVYMMPPLKDNKCLN